jgi:hypothetical protein
MAEMAKLAATCKIVVVSDAKFASANPAKSGSEKQFGQMFRQGLFALKTVAERETLQVALDSLGDLEMVIPLLQQAADELRKKSNNRKQRKSTND